LGFLAPGVEVHSTTSGGGYGVQTGASFAAAAAAGVAALVLQCRPDWSRDQLLERLRQTAAKVGPFPYALAGPHERNDHFGHGRLDAAAAVAGL
jgi:thermitase